MKIKNFLSNILIFGILLSSVPSNSFADIGEIINQIENKTDNAGAWFTGLTSMPTKRYGFTSAVIGNKIYCIGGYTGYTSLNKVEVYDTLTNTWESKKNMPTARYNLTSVVVDGKIYCIGGNGAGYLNIVEVYDPSTDTWEAKKSMPTKRMCLTSGVIDGKIYCIGGQNSSVLSATEVYDPSTNTWETKKSIPTSRGYLTSGVINGKMYCIGGYTQGNIKQSNLVEVYDPSTDTWETKNPMSSGKNALASSVINEKIYCIGGYNGSLRLDTLEVYNSKTDSWEIKTPMPTPRSNLTSAVVNGKIYCIGGTNGSSLNTVEVYDPGISNAEVLAFNAVIKAEETIDVSDIEYARNLVNQLSESKFKDELQDKLNAITPNLTFDVKNATANIDVYIKSENMLSLSLDTNNISFDNYSGVESVEMINAINLTVNSSLPYQVNAYLETEIESASGNIMDKSLLNIKSNEKSDYQKFNNLSTAVQLLDNQPSGNDIVHAIDFKLDGDDAYEADTYKTSIKFEASQK